jgi:hypothetical protein
MFRPRRTTSTTAPRLAASVALALIAGALAGCGSSHTTTAPIVTGPGAPGPMLTLAGDPHGNVTFTGYMLHASAADTVSGYFYLAMTDSVNHPQFATDVTINGVAMRPERDGLDQPWRYSLLPTDLGLAFQAGDTLHISVVDTSGATGSFTLAVVPSSMKLPGDAANIVRSKDLLLDWNGAAENVLVQLVDRVGYRVRANLQFQNESGINQLLIRAQDLAPMTLGELVGSATLQNGEQRNTPRSKLLTANVSVIENRHWTLVP